MRRTSGAGWAVGRMVLLHMVSISGDASRYAPVAIGAANGPAIAPDRWLGGSVDQCWPSKAEAEVKIAPNPPPMKKAT